MKKTYLGWDIGGAHLKLAWLDECGQLIAVRQIASPLWRGVEALALACDTVDLPLGEAGIAHAITMTGELCDVFEERSAGVREILACVLPRLHAKGSVRIYAGATGWLDTTSAVDAAAQVASANWSAMASFVAAKVQDGLVIDIGSTTTDILPLSGGKVLCNGHDDASRLANCELVYTGVVRTPVFAVCTQVPFRGAWQPLVPEYFATMSDVYRVIGELDPADDLMPTADGRGKDLAASAARLARMLGIDLEINRLHEIHAVARYVAEQQQQCLGRAVALISSRASAAGSPMRVIGAGVGRFLGARIARATGAEYIDFGTLAGADGGQADAAAIAAPAVSVAKLLWMAR